MVSNETFNRGRRQNGRIMRYWANVLGDLIIRWHSIGLGGLVVAGEINDEFFSLAVGGRCGRRKRRRDVDEGVVQKGI